MTEGAEPMSEARQAAERAVEELNRWWNFTPDPDDVATEVGIVEGVIAPLLAAMTQCCWCAKNFPDKGAVKIHMELCERHPMTAERDRLAAQVERLREWWRFDDHQQPLSSWHEREDFIERMNEALSEQPHA